MKKRANGSGTIRFNKQRRLYEVRVMVDGKRRKVSGKTQRDAWDRAAELGERPQTTSADDYTVSSWLNEWLDGSDHLSPVTLESYRSMIKNHIAPAIGSVPLAELSRLQVRQMLTGMKAKGLSSNTQRLAKATLQSGLSVAEELELVPRNVAAFRGVGTPMQVAPGRSLTVEQVQTLHGAVDTNPIGPLVFVLVSTGLRRGEALGLKWSDIDLDAGTIQVRRAVKLVNGRVVLGEPKTARSRRTVDIGPETIRVLADLDRTSEFVFPSRLGNPLDPTAATQRVKRFTTKVLGQPWTPHEMRHSCASLLVSAGVSIKVVSDMLGHSSVTLTANTYSHLTPEARAETARAFSTLLKTPALVEGD